MTASRTLLIAAEKLTRRLHVLRRLQACHRELGDTEVLLNVEELFEPADAEALAAFEQALQEHHGAVPLFERVV